MKPNASIIGSCQAPLHGLNEKLINRYKCAVKKGSLPQSLREILRIPMPDRTYEDIIFIYEFILTYKYCKHLKNKYGQEALFRIAQFMTLNFVTGNTIIVEKNTQPEYAILIIEGHIFAESQDVQNYYTGDSLFDEFIIKGETVPYSFIASKETHYLIMDKHIIFVLSLSQRKMDMKPKYLKFYEQFDWLEILGNFDQVDLIQYCRREEYKQNMQISNENEDSIYFIIQGTIRVVQKIGSKKIRNSINDKSLETLIVENLIQKEQLQAVGQMNTNDIFGFEEHILNIPKNQYRYIIESNEVQLISFKLDFFFTKINQVFNLYEFQQLIRIACYRIQYRNKINSLQITIYNESTNQPFADDSINKQLEQIGQSLTLTNSPRISSKKKNKFWFTSLHPNNDAQPMKKSMKVPILQNQYESVTQRIADNQEKKRVELKLNSQLNKLLEANKLFNENRKLKEKLQREEQLDFQNKILQYKNKKISLNALKDDLGKDEAKMKSSEYNQFNHISLSQDRQGNTYKEIFDKQNAEQTLFPQLERFHTKIKNRKTIIYATPLRRNVRRDYLEIL